jgi:CHAT domain-containing protein
LALPTPTVAQVPPPTPQQPPDERQTVAAGRDELWKAAHQLESDGRLDEAAAKIREMIPHERQLVGEQHDELAIVYCYLADLEVAAEKMAEAKTDREEALKIKIGLYGKDHWQTMEIGLAVADCDALAKLSPLQRKDWISADQSMRRVVSLAQENKAADALDAAGKAAEAFSASAGLDHWRTAAALSFQGQLLSAQGQGDKAIAAFKRAADIDEKILGDHPTTTSVLDKLGEEYLRKTDPEAVAVLDRALKINQRVLGPEAPDTLVTMNDLGVAYLNEKDYPRALALHERALEIRKRLLGDEHPHTLLSLNALAQTHVAAKEYDKALPLLIELRQLREKTLGPENRETVMVLSSLARTYYELKKFDDALPLYEQLKILDERVLGPADKYTVGDLNVLAEIYRSKGNYAAAKDTSERIVATADKVYGAENPSTAAAYDNMANQAHYTGDYAAALAYGNKALAIREKVLGPNHRDTARSLLGLGSLYADMDRPTDALPLLQRALRIFEEATGPESMETQSALNSLAMFYWKHGENAVARPLAERALKIAEKSVVPSDSLVTSENDVATIDLALGDLPAALAMCQRALKTSEQVYGPAHPTTGLMYHRVASVYERQEDYDSALKYERQALDIAEKVSGPDDPDVCKIVHGLAKATEAKGDLGTAQALFERNLDARKKVLGPDNSYTMSSTVNLAALYELEGNYTAAMPLAKEALKQARRHLDNYANVQSEHRQYALHADLRFQFDTFLSAAIATELPAAETYESVLEWKGVTSARQRWIRAARQSLQNNPEAVRLYAQLEAQSRALAGAYGVAVPANQRAAQEEYTSHLSQEVQDLQRQLAQVSQEFRAAQTAIHCTPAMLRDCLPKGTALVDIAEFARFTKSDVVGAHMMDKPRALVAFIVRPDRDIEMVDLGPSLPISQAVLLWRVANVPRELKKEERPLAERVAAAWVNSYGASSRPAEKLRQWIWEPLATHLDGCNTVLIAPDGALAYFPWAALPGNEAGHFLLEDVALAAIPIPQLLPELMSKPPSVDNPTLATGLLLMGDVHMTGDPGAPRQPSQAVTAQKSAEQRQTLGDLPRSREEIAAISKTFTHAFPTGYVKQLTGDDPTEQAFRDFAPRATFIHLAVHGFFEPPRRSAGGHAPDSSESVFAGDPAVALVHPDLLCGLAFVGSGLPPQPNKDDGILTGLELKALNLDHVDLVTLTSCQSALGLQAPAEGVLGIQRAFQVAGARSILASLWSVPVGTTDTLMEDFYDNLWNKKLSRVEALRQAQLKLLHNGHKEVVKDLGKTVDDTKGLSPFYWAAFTLAGDWR